MAAPNDDDIFNRFLAQATKAIEANHAQFKNLLPWERDAMLKRIEHLMDGLERAAKPPTEKPPADSHDTNA